MKKSLLILAVVTVLAAAIYWGGPRLRDKWRRRHEPKFLTEKVVRGNIKWTVQATGTVEPMLKIRVGSFVSGPILELHVDFNDQVEEGQLLAKVDPRIYKATVARDRAALARAKADVKRVTARLHQAINDEKRARKLRDINEGYLSDTEMDQLRFSREALDAELEVAKLQIEQAQAQLDNSELNLAYTDIVAPRSGVVIDRKIDPGQTLAAQFQTPELFVIAPDMDKQMWVHANVVEADVGHVLRAQKEKRPVEFYVDAYEGELFTGWIKQVRQNPTTESNVVTYPVVVETANPNWKLLPGMTANMSFEIEKRQGVIKIPGAAVRYMPDKQWVREEDKKILDGSDKKSGEVTIEPSAEDRVEAIRRRHRRHVWVKEGEKLRAIEIEFGLSDGRYYELVDGDLEVGQQLVTGVEEKK